MPIDIKQLNQSELSGFITGAVGRTFVDIVGNEVVYTDITNQTISGFKTFINPPNVPYAGTTGQVVSQRYLTDKINLSSGALNDKITALSGVQNFFDFKGDFTSGTIYHNHDAIYYNGGTYGYTGNTNFTGIVNGTPLSGSWHQLAASGMSGISGATGPIGSYNFINSGTISGVFFDPSFFIDIPYSGLNIMEIFTPHSGMLTGYALGCWQSGVGPMHLSSGTSGDLLINPLTGSIYVRNSGNTKSIIQGFTMDSGVNFIKGFIPTGSGLFNLYDRIGIDLYSGLSGMQGFTIGVFGFGYV